MIQNLQKGALNTDGQMFEGAFRPNRTIEVLESCLT